MAAQSHQAIVVVFISFLLLMILIIAIHSLFEYPHHYTYFFLPLLILIGVLDNEEAKASIGNKKLTMHRLKAILFYAFGTNQSRVVIVLLSATCLFINPHRHFSLSSN